MPKDNYLFDVIKPWAIAFAVAVAAIAFAAMKAEAGDVCQIRKVVHPIVADYQLPLIAYRVALPLREEAVATHQLRHSEEYVELQQLRGYKAGVEAVSQSLQAGSRPPLQADTGHPSQPEEGIKPPEPPAPPQSPYPTLVETCAKCHSGNSPKGDIWLDGSVKYDSPEMAEKRDAIVQAIRTGNMPPTLEDGKRLPPEKLDAIEDEIHGVQVVAD